MMILITHQIIVVSKFVDNNETLPTHHFHYEAYKRIYAKIGNDLHLRYATLLQHTENSDFPHFSPFSIFFSHCLEAILIGLNLPSEQKFSILTLSDNLIPDTRKGLEHGGTIQSRLVAGLQGRDFQLKELQESKPVFGRDSDLSDPSDGSVRELIAKSSEAISWNQEGIDLSLLTSRTETTESNERILCRYVLLGFSNKLQKLHIRKELQQLNNIYYQIDSSIAILLSMRFLVRFKLPQIKGKARFL